MSGIRIKRRSAQQGNGAQVSKRPPYPPDWFDDFMDSDDWCADQMALTEELERRVKSVRDRLLTLVLELECEQQLLRPVRLDEELPRSLWMLLLHRAVIEDFGAELVEFGGVFVDEDDRPLDEATLLFERDDGSECCISVFAANECLGGSEPAQFLNETRWRELTLRWLIHELAGGPGTVKAKLRAVLPQRRK